MFYDRSFADKKRTKLGIFFAEKTFEKLAKTAAEYSPLKILEVGVGRGAFYEHLKKEIPAMEYTGIEASEVLFERAKSKGINVIKCFVPPFPQNLEKGGFDLIIMSHVIEHFINYREVLEVLKELNGLLRKNGKFLLFYPCALDCGNDDFFNCDYSHSYMTTKYRVENLLIDSGFQIVKQDYYRACYNTFKPFFYILYKVVRIFAFSNIKMRLTFSKNLLTIAEKI